MSARAWLAIYAPLLLASVSCGDADPLGKQETPAEDQAVEEAAEPDRETARDAGIDARAEPPPREPTATMVVDARVLLERDAGSRNTESSELPADAAVVTITSPALGRAYAESEYILEQPNALEKAFGAVAGATGDTRLFVTELYAADAGSALRYGPADLIDGGLVWQKPPARPRTFALAASEDDGQTLVSAPFKYILEARIALSASKVFRLYLEAEQSTFRATFDPAFTQIVSGELRGVLTREQLEHRPLDLASCSAACGPANLSFCSSSRELHLADAFDCNDAKPDVDADGDGSLDSYRLLVRFKARQVAPPAE